MNMHGLFQLLFVYVLGWGGSWYFLRWRAFDLFLLTNFFLFSLQDGEFNWDNELQGFILGSFFYGYISTQLVGGRLAEAYGTKWLLFGSILSSSALSVLTPFAARWSPYAFIALRVLMGIGEVSASQRQGLQSLIYWSLKKWPTFCPRHSKLLYIYWNFAPEGNVGNHRWFW